MVLQRYPALAAFHADAAAALGCCGGWVLLCMRLLCREGTIKQILALPQNVLTSGDDRQFHNKCMPSNGEIYFQRKLLFPFSSFSCLKVALKGFSEGWGLWGEGEDFIFLASDPLKKPAFCTCIMLKAEAG